uniref:HTH myb-type domain-containing protein n=1 Tax=Cynoglossus semilaevis TaxID=244447 RepID=A0A3P8VJQ1_CYNSE
LHKLNAHHIYSTNVTHDMTAFMCLQTYQRFVSKTVKRSKWTPDEDNQLRELVEKMRIGNFIPYTQLIYRWNHVLDPTLRKGHWTKEEDRVGICKLYKATVKSQASFIKFSVSEQKPLTFLTDIT